MEPAIGEDCTGDFRVATVIAEIIMPTVCIPVPSIASNNYGNDEKYNKVRDAYNADGTQNRVWNSIDQVP